MVFSYDDYREFITEKVESAPKKWGEWGRLAQAAGCQATYLSQVMKEKAHLTSDHVFKLAKYWGMNESETDFFFLLLEYARAGSEELSKHLYNKMKKIRRERENIAKRLKKDQVEIGERETFFYSAWYWVALHAALQIPEYQTTQALSRKLELPIDFVEQAMVKLQEYGFVKNEDGRWLQDRGDVHIPRESLMIGVHHNNWRQRAVTDSTMRREESIHFTGIYTLSREHYEHLREKMLELIEHSSAVASDTEEEEMIGFLCDLFVV